MTKEEFFDKLELQLNSQQLDATTTVDGPVLLLAVPGSGKTTVLVSRLGYMLYVKGIEPEKILTITYTVAATKDMQNRFHSMFGPTMAQRMEFRTINGICAKIIYSYGKQIGKEPFELCTDEKRLSAILAAIYQKVENEYPTDSDLKGVRTYISYIKNRMLSEDEMKTLEKETDYQIVSLYKLYNQTLRNQKMMDYDDQMVYALAILRSNPAVLEVYQKQYPYICVDEAQDTSKLQHAIIALLAKKTENLFMVGDEDQSIYGFRAAYPQALLEFEKDHPGAKVLYMEENYRSNSKIVDAADQFIQKNTLRHKKQMRASREAGSEIRLINVKSRGAQYQYLLKVAETCQEETAVLYRDNECILPLLDLLERQAIPYQIKNADLSFFTHRIVKDIRAIILFAEDPYDTDLFMQIYFKINTYLNKKKAEDICQLARAMEIPVLDAAIDHTDLEHYTKKNLRALRTNLVNMRKDTAAKAMFRVMEAAGYRDYLERNDISDSKVQILKALSQNESSAMGLVRRLDELQKIIQTKPLLESCPFLLSTIHSSKGLEYETVYLIDVYDGLFPETVIQNRKKANSEELALYEEERRLFYVGVTRAKNNLSLFQWQDTSTFISQFMKLKPEPAKRRGIPKSGQSIKETYQMHAEYNLRENQESFEAFRQKFGEGVIVRHKKFGEGVVTEVDHEKIYIMFDEDVKAFYVQMLFRLNVIQFL